MYIYGTDDHFYQQNLTFNTDGYKYLNITYSTATTKDQKYRTLFEVLNASGGLLKTIIDDHNVMSNRGSTTVKIDVSGNNKVTLLIYLYVGNGRSRTLTITKCELTNS